MSLKLFRNARIFTPLDTGRPLAGTQQGYVQHWERGALLSRHGVIERIGHEAQVTSGIPLAEVDLELDCGGRCIVPGLVDPHTHMCFRAKREEEFGRRLEGVPYLEILREGGGILSSVRDVRSAREGELLNTTLKHARSALAMGTTTVEIKSGYGLDTETEMKMLRVIDRVRRETPLDVVGTFLGAHAVPEEHRGDPERYVDLLISEMIPTVAASGLARFCDVFCERGVFSVAQSRRILQAARKLGMGLKIHADEVHDLGGARLAAELRATSAEHLLAAGDAGLKAMVEAGVVAVLLPGTALCLRKPYARARAMIDLGVPLALATDCNPGSCYSESMPLSFALAVLNMNLSINEALVASTLNAAYSIGMAPGLGSLDVGKQADFLLLEGRSPTVLAYHTGVSSVVEAVQTRGKGCMMLENGKEDRSPGLDAFLRVMDPTDNAVGGGTASSVAGAMAAALVAMVARLSVGKPGLEPEAFYQPIIEEAELLARELMEGGRADARAFDGVMVVYRLPRTSEEEKRFRHEAIQRAMVVAALTPLANAQRCRRVLDLQRTLQGRSNANAVSDLTCAAHLSLAGIRGCLDNVRVNLRFIENGVEARAISTEVDDLNRFVKENGSMASP